MLRSPRKSWEKPKRKTLKSEKSWSTLDPNHGLQTEADEKRLGDWWGKEPISGWKWSLVPEDSNSSSVAQEISQAWATSKYGSLMGRTGVELDKRTFSLAQKNKGKWNTMSHLSAVAWEASIQTKWPELLWLTSPPPTCLSWFLLNFLNLEKSTGGYEYILIVLDHFTRFAQAYACRNKSANTAADKVFGDFVLKFGFPMKLHHDQGREYYKLFVKLKECSGVKGSQTTLYHLHGNNHVEQFNQTLLAMLRTLPEIVITWWSCECVQLHEVWGDGFAPYYLLFGHTPQLPIDILFGVTVTDRSSSYSDYAVEWRKRIMEAYKLVSRVSQKEKERRKTLCTELN